MGQNHPYYSRLLIKLMQAERGAAQIEGVSPSTARGSDKHEIGLSIGTSYGFADKCLTGLISQDFKIRLQIFITWQRKRKRKEEKKGTKMDREDKKQEH